MTHKLRAIGLTFATVFALSAVSASTAAAVQFHSNTNALYGTLSQIGTNTLDMEIGNAKCKVLGGLVIGTGKTTSSVTAGPEFKECTAFGLEATVDRNGCDYSILASGVIEIECPTTGGGVTEEIRITVNPVNIVCIIDVPTQSLEATYANEGTTPTRDVKVTPKTTSAIKYRVTYPKGETEGKCGKAGLHTDGKYTGSFTIKGFKDAPHTEQADLWVE